MNEMNKTELVYGKFSWHTNWQNFISLLSDHWHYLILKNINSKLHGNNRILIL